MAQCLQEIIRNLTLLLLHNSLPGRITHASTTMHQTDKCHLNSFHKPGRWLKHMHHCTYTDVDYMQMPVSVVMCPSSTPHSMQVQLLIVYTRTLDHNINWLGCKRLEIHTRNTMRLNSTAPIDTLSL